MTGALNPVHRGHIDMLTVAKNALELQTKMKVVAGYISPSNCLYVRPKMNNTTSTYWSSSARAKMVDLAISDSGQEDWLECGRWEMTRAAYWPDFPDVCEAANTYINEQINLTNQIKTLYVCGSDHFNKCITLPPVDGVVVVVRNNENITPSMYSIITEPMMIKATHLDTNDNISKISSTIARTWLDLKVSKYELSHIVYPSVAKYLHKEGKESTNHIIY